LPNNLQVDRVNLAVLAPLAVAHCHHLALLRLFLGGLRDVKPTGGHGLLFNPLHDDTVLQRSEIHAFTLLSSRYFDL
jgi:hypothetical protein